MSWQVPNSPEPENPVLQVHVRPDAVASPVGLSTQLAFESQGVVAQALICVHVAEPEKVPAAVQAREFEAWKPCWQVTAHEGE